ncbi:MAG: hypothetical protein ACI9OJ_002596 [Myxococcota bacterium]|jgi:hypothetical protein
METRSGADRAVDITPIDIDAIHAAMQAAGDPQRAAKMAAYIDAERANLSGLSIRDGNRHLV